MLLALRLWLLAPPSAERRLRLLLGAVCAVGVRREKWHEWTVYNILSRVHSSPTQRVPSGEATTAALVEAERAEAGEEKKGELPGEEEDADSCCCCCFEEGR